MLYPTGSTTHAFATTKKQGKTRHGSRKFSQNLCARKNCGIMSATIDLEDMVDNTHSCNINLERDIQQRIT